MLKKAIELIRAKKTDEGRKILVEYLSGSCVALIMNKIKTTNRNEALSVFFDALLIFIDQVESNKFEYQADEKLISYFRTICTNKAREYSRFIHQGYVLSEEILNENLQEYSILYEETRDEIFEQKIKQGYELKKDDITEDFPVEVIREFHNLNEKCKFLIILKYKLKLKHDEIVEALAPFFKLKNKEVSKAELQRCMQFLRSRIDGSQRS